VLVNLTNSNLGMKPVKSVFLFVISLATFSACFNPPEFDDSPQIAFESISFAGKTAPTDKEILTISLSFKDGDGDLGIDNLVDIDSPYNHVNFFANDNGNLIEVSSVLIEDFTGYRYKKNRWAPNPSYLIGRPSKKVGELITFDSRNQGFSLPPLERPYDCSANHESYLNESLTPDTVFIFRNYAYLIKDHTKIVDTLVSDRDPNEWYYAVADFFYINVNDRHFNIKVQFFYYENGSFVEYNWPREYCTTFDGRFPIFSDGSRPLEGTLQYAMESTGFYSELGNRTLKLFVTITDRAGRVSNTVETREFKLDDI
jgi:hypothetical protein